MHQSIAARCHPLAAKDFFRLFRPQERPIVPDTFRHIPELRFLLPAADQVSFPGTQPFQLSLELVYFLFQLSASGLTAINAMDQLRQIPGIPVQPLGTGIIGCLDLGKIRIG